MSDANYAHEFDPNRKGLCKALVGGRKLGYRICHKPADDIVHQRWAAMEADRLNRLSQELADAELSEDW